jgi:hypothetical protein
LNLRDLVANGSVTSQGAQVLGAIGASGRSFLVHALPRGAGKSTLTDAILAESPATVLRQDFYGSQEEFARLSAAPTRGRLVVAELGHRGRRGYLAGEEIVRLFDLLSDGYTVASSLHADSVDEVFDVLRSNGIPAALVATVPYLVKIRVLGDPDLPSTPRVVEAVYEITPVGTGGVSRAMLYQWDGVPALQR